LVTPSGGGGKGMRKVESEKDFDAMLASCQREAKSSFGNDDVLIEKYIQSPRHIEVQVFGDTHGNVVHMFERDCSLQRRHQKVIEEAPAPGMTDAVRKAMTDAAIKAAKAVDYVGAGTVEFIVDGSGKLRTDGFWFMEMNTRLQVEHPVTEMITGLDLVELQIRVAQGEKLPKQKDIKMDGHAVEARLYAEDPANDFLPSIGTIWGIATDGWVNDSGSCRIDAGIADGNVVSIYYDPMIAKVIGWSDERYHAIEYALEGLYEIQAAGITTNSAFLVKCLSNSEFINGNISTSFIADQSNTLIMTDFNTKDEMLAHAALWLKFDSEKKHRQDDPFKNANGWRLNLTTNERYWFLRDGEPTSVQILKQDDLVSTVKVGDDGTPFDIYMNKADHEIKEFSEYFKYNRNWKYRTRPDHVSITLKGRFSKIYFYNADTETLSISGKALTAPMPGKIIAVNAKAGDAVSAGDPLIIMEAMKMEMTLEAPRDGIVAEVTATADALVTDGEMLLSLEEDENK